ncbi:MAG: DUF1080 domain-containing protein [Verrucomicrobia bacterium]|nr:MAG: DUF1080 domain-containing protein [Verrucomicrobiota bacterium]
MRPLFLLFATAALSAAQTPPAGFTALLNGTDLAGWRGGDTSDQRRLLAMPEAERTELLKTWTADMRQHWKVVDGELLNDGKGKYATTEKEYGDFELLVDYNMAPLGDSGIYLRNVPQVQIWDHTNKKEWKNGAQKGSGGLWNNSPGAPGKDPLVLADKPAGEWNTLRVVMVGARVSVWLNGQQTVDHAILENYYDRQVAIASKGPLCLQAHGAPIKWRHLFIREISGTEANQWLAAKSNTGFMSIFNGKDFDGWAGDIDNYQVVEAAIRCKPQQGGNIYQKADLTDFAARLEFKLPPGGNNGLCIRYPGSGNTAYVGMCECQVLDDNYEAATHNQIDPRQAHGSAYGMVAAQRGYQRPIGEWNFEEVTVVGPTLKVELNGFVILDADLSKVDVATVMGKSAHPGKDRTHGFFGFAGHNDPVEFRAISIRDMGAKK